MTDLSGMSVMLHSENQAVLDNAMMEVAHTKRLNGMNLDGCLVMGHHSDHTGNSEYRVSTLCPAYADKFDIHIDLDKPTV